MNAWTASGKTYLSKEGAHESAATMPLTRMIKQVFPKTEKSLTMDYQFFKGTCGFQVLSAELLSIGEEDKQLSDHKPLKVVYALPTPGKC